MDSTGVTLLLCNLLILVTGLGAGMIGIYSLLVQSKLRRHGIRAQAIIIDHRMLRRASYRRHRAPLYFVTYRFQYQGKDYTSEQQISGARYNTLAIGASVSIRHVPSRPVNSALEQDRTSLVNAIFALAAAVILIGLAAIGFGLGISNGLM